MLSESVIRKVLISKILFGYAEDSFNSPNNPEQIAASLVLLQDSVEIYLIAVCEHLNVSLNDTVKFHEYFAALKTKTSDEAPLKKQMLNLNRQRVNVKHYGLLPDLSECSNIMRNVQSFFEELSNRYLGVDYGSISLVSLLEENKLKEMIKDAEKHLIAEEYKECQILCRKVFYLEFESKYSIAQFEDEQNSKSPILSALLSRAPYFVRDKRYVQEHVKNPTDYIVIDHADLEKDLAIIGISSVDFWNVWRLTPAVFCFGKDDWAIKEEFKEDLYNKSNAEYCFRKIIDILINKQKNEEKIKYTTSRGGILIKTKTNKTKIYEKASTNSKVVAELDSDKALLGQFHIRGIDAPRYFYYFWSSEKEDMSDMINGFVLEEDVEVIE